MKAYDAPLALPIGSSGILVGKCSYNPKWPLDQWEQINWMDPSFSQPHKQLQEWQVRRGLEAVQEGGCSTLFSTMTQTGFRLSLAQITVHRQFGISPGMKWRGDNQLIGWWTCCRAVSTHLGCPNRWLLPQRISGLVWRASCAQETWDSPRCCFSSR